MQQGPDWGAVIAATVTGLCTFVLGPVATLLVSQRRSARRSHEQTPGEAWAEIVDRADRRVAKAEESKGRWVAWAYAMAAYIRTLGGTPAPYPSEEAEDNGAG